MRYDKRGLSTVVTTLIIILLVLVAIGIIWVVIRGVVETTTEQTGAAAECFKIDVRATNVTCDTSGTSDVCNVSLRRTAGGAAIGGVKMVFYNDSQSSSIVDSADLAPAVTNIEPLTTEIAVDIDTTLANSSKVDVTVYLLDDTGADQICGITNPYNY